MCFTLIIQPTPSSFSWAIFRQLTLENGSGLSPGFAFHMWTHLSLISDTSTRSLAPSESSRGSPAVFLTWAHSDIWKLSGFLYLGWQEKLWRKSGDDYVVLCTSESSCMVRVRAVFTVWRTRGCSMCPQAQIRACESLLMWQWTLPHNMTLLSNHKLLTLHIHQGSSVQDAAEEDAWRRMRLNVYAQGELRCSF